MHVAVELASWAAILAGLFFMIVGTVGVIRMPDVYTRLHAAGMTDTMGAGFLLLGMVLQAGFGLLALRFVLVYAFLLFTSPIATHALARAALSGGVEPVRGRGGSADVEAFVDAALLALLVVTGLAVLRQRNLVAVVMLAGIYSLLCAALYTMLDAVDVAFTEAAVGAGISTVLILGTLALVGGEEKRPARRPLLPLLIVLLTGGVLLYGMSDMPPLGDPFNPAHHHVAPRYVEESGHEVGMPNIVTSVLASYRGYDTMGETTVIFTAVVAVLLLLSVSKREDRRG